MQPGFERSATSKSGSDSGGACSHITRWADISRGTAVVSGSVLRIVLASILGVGGIFLGSGCRIAKETAQLPVNVVNTVVPGSRGKATEVDPAALQAQIQRFSDDFGGRTSTGIDEYVRRAGTPEARSLGLRLRVSVGASIIGIASGPNPTANLLDYLALATLMRAELEDRAPPAPRDAYGPWLETSRSLETNAWNLAADLLTAEQQTELRTALERWRADRGGERLSFFERPQEFSAFLQTSREKQSSPGSVFSLVGLDPTAALDPAVREVTRTRMVAERALFAVQRLPMLMRWQIELLADQLLQQGQVTNALASADRLSRAVESASQTAALLPDRVTAERRAILEALESQQGRLRELSAEVTRTLAAGETMSTSLNTTIATFDALMKRFGIGEPDRRPAGTNSTPFNILDYARTAEQIATMAQQIDVLIKDTTSTLDSPALDRRIADLNALSARARADARSVLNHAFLLLGGLIVLALLSALAYRRLGEASASHRR